MDLTFDFSTALRQWSTSHRRSAWRRGEKQHSPPLGSRSVAIAPGQTCAIENVGSFAVHCARGVLWVTSPTLGCDLILSAGECLEVSTRGKLLVAAMVDSALWLPFAYALEHGVGPGRTPRIVRRLQCA